MASWISSKLKVAENLLQQIDQQAAESLRHGDRKSSDELDFAASPKLSTTVPPLKDQLKKKDSPKINTDSSSAAKIVSHEITKLHIGKQKLESDSKSPSPSPSTSTSTSTTVNDTDWTQLLSTPTKTIGPSSRRTGGNVGTRVINPLGNGRKPGAKTKVAVVAAPESRKAVVEESGNVISPIGDRENILVKDNSQAVGNKHDVSINRKGVIDDEHKGQSAITVSNRNVDVVDYVSEALKRSSLVSDSGSDSDSDSDSGSSLSSNSETEREREERIQKRRQILAAKAAAKVSEAIKEQENVVARLEGEKQSLERILEERAKQAEQEASKLQSTMIETMEAADLEKQKHNHTRMEVLARLAKLETANADLAKSLANAQWNLEMEVNNVAEHRRLVDAKELGHEELKRRIYTAHQTRTSLTSLMPYKGFELEREMLEGEVSFMTEKTAQLQEKATKLETDIDVILKEMESPTEVEVELKRRLDQLTDHLIQKQTQVEALSSEKATLLFRIEAVLRLLDENKSQINGGYISGSSREDLGETYESNGPKLRMLEHKIQSGKHHLGSLIRQLDVVFYAGAQFLARNPAAKIWSLVYLVCLHLWVLYIVFSHSQSTENSISSSVVSLENINNNIGG